MLRLLLLIPTTTYRTEDFVAAAAKLDVELVVASERPNVLESALPDNLLTLDFGDPAKAARTVAEFARRHPVDAVVPVDDRTTVVGAAIAERLGLRSSPLEAVSTTRNKHRMREAFARAGVPVPALHAPGRLRRSRGRGRARDVPLRAQADDPRRQPRRDPGRRRRPRSSPRSAGSRRSSRRRTSAGLGEGREEILVEDFIPGREVALEGLLVGGELHVLALFDKPDPLDGPYFEETIYVTPSRLPPDVQLAIAAETRWAARGARAHGGAGPRRAPRERRGAVDGRARRPHDRRPLLAHAPLRGRRSPWRSWSSATRSGSSWTRSSGSGSRPAS